jgi:drug/metabolite transporter (DMT)-like permease
VVVTQFSMPAVTMLLGWLLLSELPNLLAVGGGLLALAGVALGAAPLRASKAARRMREKTPAK